MEKPVSVKKPCTAFEPVKPNAAHSSPHARFAQPVFQGRSVSLHSTRKQLWNGEEPLENNASTQFSLPTQKARKFPTILMLCGFDTIFAVRVILIQFCFEYKNGIQIL